MSQRDGQYMKKVCIVCGHSMDNINIMECPNCGSYELKIVQSDINRINRFRIGKKW